MWGAASGALAVGRRSADKEPPVQTIIPKKPNLCADILCLLTPVP